MTDFALVPKIILAIQKLLQSILYTKIGILKYNHSILNSCYPTEYELKSKSYIFSQGNVPGLPTEFSVTDIKY